MLIKNEEVYLTRMLNYRQKKHDERLKNETKKTLMNDNTNYKIKINALINDFLNIKQYNQ